MVRSVCVGAFLASMNAVFLTVLALLAGDDAQVIAGARQIAVLGVAGGLGGVVFWGISELEHRLGGATIYGRWICAGVMMTMATVPLEAMLRGSDVRREIALFLDTPSMVLLYVVAGALGGYMAGRWIGALESPMG